MADKLAQVRALLAKAERTDSPEEAEALSAKAAELMARHNIDLAAALAEAESIPSWVVDADRFPVPAPYAIGKVSLLSSVGRSLGVEVVRSGPATGLVATVIGTEEDRAAVTVLFTSLCLQLTRAMIAVPVPEWENPRAFRNAFVAAYSSRIAARIREVHDAAEAEAGASTAIVLRDKDSAVAGRVAELFPHLRTGRPRRVSSAAGYAAGDLAGARADLGGQRLAARRQLA